jgi:hypothetical protein
VPAHRRAKLDARLSLPGRGHARGAADGTAYRRRCLRPDCADSASRAETYQRYSRSVEFCLVGRCCGCGSLRSTLACGCARLTRAVVRASDSFPYHEGPRRRAIDRQFDDHRGGLRSPTTFSALAKALGGPLTVLLE